MALLTCRECSGKVSDTAENCPHCGAPVSESLVRARPAAPAELTPVEKKSGSSWWKWLLGIPIGLFVLFVIIGLAGGWDNKKGGYSSRNEAVDAACEKMMSDSALGNERRMTRQICDQMKAANQK